jgi:hypothetical protein
VERSLPGEWEATADLGVMARRKIAVRDGNRVLIVELMALLSYRFGKAI